MVKVKIEEGINIFHLVMERFSPHHTKFHYLPLQYSKSKTINLIKGGHLSSLCQEWKSYKMVRDFFFTEVIFVYFIPDKIRSYIKLTFKAYRISVLGLLVATARVLSSNLTSSWLKLASNHSCNKLPTPDLVRLTD